LAGKEPFTITLHGFGGFPNVTRPRVVWIGLGGDRERLVALQKDVEDLLASIGILREDRPFHPHLTLGRNRAREFQTSFRGLTADWEREASDPFEVREVVLFRSDLKPGGPVYTRLTVMPLKKTI
jgi:2'-5' RNA ligase